MRRSQFIRKWLGNYVEHEINEMRDDLDKIAEYQNKELKDLVRDLFEYYPNTTGYDDIRKELLKRLK